MSLIVFKQTNTGHLIAVNPNKVVRVTPDLKNSNSTVIVFGKEFFSVVDGTVGEVVARLSSAEHD